jgi:pyruvate/2-oxoacid:ferredoxin oxidoreductase alpha subunit
VTRAYLTGNHVAGYALIAAGEANLAARGCCSGIYPITPQTEIVEYLMAHELAKGCIVPVESEHSAMGVCIGASIAGARSFTASSSNGLLYMIENVFAAGYYRLPIVLVVSNRALGPPWNIWVDQGDSLALRDAALLQFYCDTHQDLVDTILLAFRVSEDRRVLLPALVAQDGFVLSHTQMVVDMPEQRLVNRFLPPLALPHRLDHERPRMYGGMTWPRDTERQRADIQAAMDGVPAVLDEAISEFRRVFGRTPAGAFTAEQVEDAETVLVACSTMAQTARQVVATRRAKGEKVGLVRVKLFRPFLRDGLLEAIGPARRVAVLDRNHSPGSGGIFWNEIAATLAERCQRQGILLQDYVVGLGGATVTPAVIEGIVDDVERRAVAEAPRFVLEAVA